MSSVRLGPFAACLLLILTSCSKPAADADRVAALEQELQTTRDRLHQTQLQVQRLTQLADERERQAAAAMQAAKAANNQPHEDEADRRARLKREFDLLPGEQQTNINAARN